MSELRRRRALVPPIPQPAPAPAPEIDRDPRKLHPLMRNAMQEVIRECEAEALPFKLFEGWRSPQRQAALYSQGRDSHRPGPILTRARAWESYHQYGMACDFVLFIDGKWSWDTEGKFDHYWRRLTEIGEMYGLEGLSWEKPHLQIATIELAQLKEGLYPGGGDATWEAMMHFSEAPGFKMITPTT